MKMEDNRKTLKTQQNAGTAQGKKYLLWTFCFLILGVLFACVWKSPDGVKQGLGLRLLAALHLPPSHDLAMLLSLVFFVPAAIFGHRSVREKASVPRKVLFGVTLVAAGVIVILVPIAFVVSTF